MRFERVAKKGPGEYQERSGRVPGKGRIRASAGKVESRGVPKKGPGKYRERLDLGEYRKRWDPGEMLENPKQAKQSKQPQGKGVGPSMTSRVFQQMTQIRQKSNTIMTKEGGMPQYDNRKCHK